MSRTFGIGGMVMLLVIALAAIGIGIALWSKVLTIEGIVRTGSVNAEFVRVFTDDDDTVNHPDFDSQDTGNCPIHAGPLEPPTSCDPAETGRDPKLHYDKDVARCDAEALTDDQEPQPGSQRARVVIQNGYPSYHCTAWFFIHNNGTIPIHLHSATILGVPATLCQLGSTAYDLNGDTQPDIEVCLSGLEPCTGDNGRCPELQIHPSTIFPVDLDIHIMQTADQDATYEFDAEICFHQWNEETGNCPQPKVLLYNGNGSIDTSGSGGAALTSLKAHYEGLGYAVDYTSAWPGSLSSYAMVYIHTPGDADDSGTNFFTAAQKGDLSTYMSGGGRVVVSGDHSGFFGIATVNDLLAAISGNITQNADAVTPDADACAPMTDITANTATAGVAAIDPSATSSLSLSGPAISLARVDPLPFDCGGLGVTNGATYLARDGRLVVIGDSNTLDNNSFADPAADGDNATLATALVAY